MMNDEKKLNILTYVKRISLGALIIGAPSLIFGMIIILCITEMLGIEELYDVYDVLCNIAIAMMIIAFPVLVFSHKVITGIVNRYKLQEDIIKCNEQIKRLRGSRH